MTESVNIYDTANQMERDLRALPEYISLKAAFQAVMDDHEAREMFEAFRDASQSLQNQQISGDQPSDEDIQRLKGLSEKVSQNVLINDLMEKEHRVSQIINDINRIITQPLAEIYQ